MFSDYCGILNFGNVDFVGCTISTARPHCS